MVSRNPRIHFMEALWIFGSSEQHAAIRPAGTLGMRDGLAGPRLRLRAGSGLC